MTEPTPVKKPRKPRKVKEAVQPQEVVETVETQIEETNALPVVEETKPKAMVVAVLALLMLMFISYGIYKLKPFIPSAPKVEYATSVKEVRSDLVVISNKDGKIEYRSGGSVSWRYNNPGLIFYGDFAKANGAIGSDNKYAIFNSYAEGKRALEVLLFESGQGYKEKSLEDAMKFYAPKNEGFNTDFYLAVIRKDSGIPLSKKMVDFTENERATLLSTLEKIEKFKEGKVEIK